MKGKIIAIIIAIVGVIGLLIGGILLFTGDNKNSSSTNNKTAEEIFKSSGRVFSMSGVTYYIDKDGKAYRAGEGYGKNLDAPTEFRKISDDAKEAAIAHMSDIILKKNGEVYYISSSVDKTELIMSDVDYLVSDGSEFCLLVTKSKELYVIGYLSSYHTDVNDYGLSEEDAEKAYDNEPVKLMDDVKYVKTDGNLIGVINNKDEFYVIGVSEDNNLDPMGKPFKIADNVKTFDLYDYTSASYVDFCQTSISYVTNDNKLYAYGCKHSYDVSAIDLYEGSQLIREDVEDVVLVNRSLGVWIKDVNNDLYASGNNAFGILGSGDEIYTSDFKKIFSNVDKIYDGYIITKDKELYVSPETGAGDLCPGNDEDKSDIKKLETNVEHIVVGHGLFITKNDNNIYACGSNYDGELGFEKGKKVLTPTKIVLPE